MHLPAEIWRSWLPWTLPRRLVCFVWVSAHCECLVLGLLKRVEGTQAAELLMPLQQVCGALHWQIRSLQIRVSSLSKSFSISLRTDAYGGTWMLNMGMSALLSCSLIDIGCSRKNSLATFLIMNNFPLRKVQSKSSLALRVYLTQVSKSCVINLTCVSLENCTCEFAMEGIVPAAEGAEVQPSNCSDVLHSNMLLCKWGTGGGLTAAQPESTESMYFNIWGHAHYISNLFLLFLVLLPSHLHKVWVSELARMTSLYLQCWWRTLRYVL